MKTQRPASLPRVSETLVTSGGSDEVAVLFKFLAEHARGAGAGHEAEQAAVLGLGWARGPWPSSRCLQTPRATPRAKAPPAPGPGRPTAASRPHPGWPPGQRAAVGEVSPAGPQAERGQLPGHCGTQWQRGETGEPLTHPAPLGGAAICLRLWAVAPLPTRLLGRHSWPGPALPQSPPAAPACGPDSKSSPKVPPRAQHTQHSCGLVLRAAALPGQGCCRPQG